MKFYIKNIIKIINTYNSGKKICLCYYNKYFLNLLGFLLENKIINRYDLLFINNIKYIIVFINKLFLIKFFTNSNSLNLTYKKILNKFKNFGLMLLNTNLGILKINECILLEIGGKPLFLIL